MKQTEEIRTGMAPTQWDAFFRLVSCVLCLVSCVYKSCVYKSCVFVSKSYVFKSCVLCL